MGVGAFVAVLGARLVIEKAMDMQSTGALSQADVRQFYDNLSPLRCGRHMISLGADARWAAAVVRHQVAPEVRICIGTHTASVGNRTMGALTGSRLAGALGRLAVRDIMRAVAAASAARAFAPHPHSVSVAPSVDNLIFAGEDASSAEAMYAIAVSHADAEWGLDISRKSIEVVVPRGALIVPAGFPAKRHTKFLGHIVAGGGSMALCWGRNSSGRSVEALGPPRAGRGFLRGRVCACLKGSYGPCWQTELPRGRQTRGS